MATMNTKPWSKEIEERITILEQRLDALTIPACTVIPTAKLGEILGCEPGETPEAVAVQVVRERDTAKLVCDALRADVKAADDGRRADAERHEARIAATAAGTDCIFCGLPGEAPGGKRGHAPECPLEEAASRARMAEHARWQEEAAAHALTAEARKHAAGLASVADSLLGYVTGRVHSGVFGPSVEVRFHPETVRAFNEAVAAYRQSPLYRKAAESESMAGPEMMPVEEANSQKAPCCERDADGDGNCDRHPSRPSHLTRADEEHT